jgi:DNA-binding Xre family transcriptional regulator
MSASQDLIAVLKQELKASDMTYADLAEAIGMAESSVKRIFAKGDTTLTKIDEICRALKLDFSDLARKLADRQVLLAELSAAQEKGLVADKKLLLVAICVLSQWTLEQITKEYLLSQADGIRCLAQLDRLGVIELRPLNRYQLKLAKAFRWRPHGPIMNFFRENALLEYFGGGFDEEGEGLLLVHGSVSRAIAPVFIERLQRVVQDFSRQHLADQKLAEKDRQGYALVLGMRSWEFEAFRALRRTKEL